jgi:hypothetical protein
LNEDCMWKIGRGSEVVRVNQWVIGKLRRKLATGSD